MFHQQQSTPPHSPRTIPLDLTKVNGSSSFDASPLSPSSGSHDDLSARCRALARSVGEIAREELWKDPEHAAVPHLSPLLASQAMLSPPASPSAAYFSPLSPRALGPTTPDGSFSELEEIQEEREDGREVDLMDLGAEVSPSGEQAELGSRRASALTDEEGSDPESGRGRRRRSSGHGSLQLTPIKCASSLPRTAAASGEWD